MPWRKKGTSGPYLRGWTLARPKNRFGKPLCTHAPSCAICTKTACTSVLDNWDRQRQDFQEWVWHITFPWRWLVPSHTDFHRFPPSLDLTPRLSQCWKGPRFSLLLAWIADLCSCLFVKWLPPWLLLPLWKGSSFIFIEKYWLKVTIWFGLLHLLLAIRLCCISL